MTIEEMTRVVKLYDDTALTIPAGSVLFGVGKTVIFLSRLHDGGVRVYRFGSHHPVQACTHDPIALMGVIEDMVNTTEVPA